MTDRTEPLRPRLARCLCGALQAETIGEPLTVNACSCTDCQRATGSVLAVISIWPVERVTLSGSAASYQVTADSGRRFIRHFCPNCGATFRVSGDVFQDRLGILVGAFADPAFPPPANSIWERSKPHWLTIPADRHFPESRT